MKHKGCILEFTEQRNKELMRAFRHALNESSFVEISKVSELTVNTPCSRFWVSEERAYKVVLTLLNGQYSLDSMRPLKREMFLEIFKRVLAIRKECPERHINDIVFDVVNSPAPKFYLDPRCAMEYIYKIKKNAHKQKHHPEL